MMKQLQNTKYAIPNLFLQPEYGGGPTLGRVGPGWGCIGGWWRGDGGALGPRGAPHPRVYSTQSGNLYRVSLYLYICLVQLLGLDKVDYGLMSMFIACTK